jgi:hypothetical protein
MSLIDMNHPCTFTMFALALALATTGCVRRTIEISTTPEGALVWVNGREVGRTPLSVDFTHYGTYDLMIKKKGWEPIIDAKTTPVPILDSAGLDLIVEILPVDVHHVVKWHIDMERRDGSRRALLKRANELRASLSGDLQASVEKTLNESP